MGRKADPRPRAYVYERKNKKGEVTGYVANVRLAHDKRVFLGTKTTKAAALAACSAYMENKIKPAPAKRGPKGPRNTKAATAVLLAAKGQPLSKADRLEVLRAIASRNR